MTDSKREARFIVVRRYAYGWFYQQEAGVFTTEINLAKTFVCRGDAAAHAAKLHDTGRWSVKVFRQHLEDMSDERRREALRKLERHDGRTQGATGGHGQAPAVG